jgi:hypothetical protein
MLMIKPKSILIIIFLSFSLMIILSGCSIFSSTQKVRAIGEKMARPIYPTEYCCNKYAINNSVYSIDAFRGNRICCDNTTNPTACNVCVDEQIVLQKENAFKAEQIREKENAAAKWYIALAIVYALLLIGSFLILIIDMIVHTVRGNGFLNRGWKIAAYIIFGVCLLLLLFVIFRNF